MVEGEAGRSRASAACAVLCQCTTQRSWRSLIQAWPSGWYKDVIVQIRGWSLHSLLTWFVIYKYSMPMTTTSCSKCFPEQSHLSTLLPWVLVAFFAVGNSSPRTCLQVAVGLCAVDSNHAYPGSSAQCELWPEAHIYFLGAWIVYSVTKVEDLQVRPELHFHLCSLKSTALLRAFTILTSLTFLLGEQIQ